MKNPSRKGLSQVGVLVIVGSVFVVFLLLLFGSMYAPGVQAALKKARRVSCMNNMRQIGIGMVNYATDNENSLLPDADGWNAAIVEAVGQTRGSETQGIFYCPADPRGEGFLGYGMNPGLSGQPLEAVVNPSETILLVESEKGVCDDPQNVARKRHDGRVNVLFADLHVKAIEVGSLGKRWKEKFNVEIQPSEPQVEP